MKLMSCLALCLTAASLFGCATPPTVVKENPERRLQPLQLRANAPGRAMVITPETVVIDARPAFDYSVGHIPGSISLRWFDFSEHEPSQRGLLQNDLFGIARRLASHGIAPDSHVIVVGNGKDGEGEEGRIVWMLSYLGVENAQFADIDFFEAQRTTLNEASPRASAQIWTPEPVASLLVSQAELRHVLNHNGTREPTLFVERETQRAVVESKVQGDDGPLLYRLIDVREAGDYLGHSGLGAKKHIPNMGAINIPWREFFDADFRVRAEMRERLHQVGIAPEHRIIVFSRDGVSSAAVTMALRALGFAKAGNYAGGLNELLASSPPSKEPRLSPKRDSGP